MLTPDKHMSYVLQSQQSILDTLCTALNGLALNCGIDAVSTTSYRRVFVSKQANCPQG